MDSIPQNGIAKANVFDFGVRLEKKFTIADAFDIHPAIGFALHSFPQDSVTYRHSDPLPKSDPLPLKRWYGASLKINLLDLFGLTYAREREYAVVDQEFTDHHGYKIQITPFFAVIGGSMVDSAGCRFEEQTGHVLTFNYQNTLNALIRCANLINPDISEKLQTPNRLAEKYHIKPNLYIQYATSSIHSVGDISAREDQTREEFTFGFSIIGDLSSLSLKKAHCNNKKPIVIKPSPDKSISTDKSKKDTNSQIRLNEPVKHDTSTVNDKPLEDGDLFE